APLSPSLERRTEQPLASTASVSPPPQEDGFLFPVETQLLERQPWATPREPELSSEESVRREKILADIADSYLATREQRVAHILSRFPETRDSDTALCIRYWRMFQAQVLERWDPLELEV